MDRWLIGLLACAMGLSASTAWAQTFEPTRVLPGVRKVLKDAGASFTMPKGWAGAWLADELYGLAPKAAEPNAQPSAQPSAQGGGAGPGSRAGSAAGQGGVFLTGGPASPSELTMPMAALLERKATEVGARFERELPGVSQLPWQVVEQGAYAGGTKGRLVLRAAAAQGSLQGYVGLIRVEAFIYVVAGLWGGEQSANYLAAADTVFASLAVTPPQANQALMARLGGCWKYYGGTTPDASGGHASSNRRYHFDPRGTYSYHSSMWISLPGASANREQTEQGSFRVYGETLLLTPEGEQPRRLQLSFQGGGLHLGNGRYLPCDR